MRSLVWQ